MLNKIFSKEKEVYMTGIGEANDKEYFYDKSENEADCKNLNSEAISKERDDNDIYQINLSNAEKVVCLKEIIKRLKKVLYVYDKSMEPNSNYNYKHFCGGLLIYVSSSNFLFNGELVNIVVNLNAIVTNDFPKQQIKRIVFEAVNYAQYLLNNYNYEYNKEMKKQVDNIESNEERTGV